jgi:ABC-type uncharacterized transport system ATPase subunit
MVCDRVSIMDRGVLKKLGRVDELVSGGQVEIIASNVQNGLRENLAVFAPEYDALGRANILASEDDAVVAHVLDTIRAGRGHVVSITPKRRTLEDIFVETVTERIGRTPTNDDGSSSNGNGSASANGGAKIVSVATPTEAAAARSAQENR